MFEYEKEHSQLWHEYLVKLEFRETKIIYTRRGGMLSLEIIDEIANFEYICLDSKSKELGNTINIVQLKEVHIGARV